MCVVWCLGLGAYVGTTLRCAGRVKRRVRLMLPRAMLCSGLVHSRERREMKVDNTTSLRLRLPMFGLCCRDIEVRRLGRGQPHVITAVSRIVCEQMPVARHYLLAGLQHCCPSRHRCKRLMDGTAAGMPSRRLPLAVAGRSSHAGSSAGGSQMDVASRAMTLAPSLTAGSRVKPRPGLPWALRLGGTSVECSDSARSLELTGSRFWFELSGCA